ncbi:MAG: hypothetical protein OSB55_10800 [Verrucomicrobiota bacterium]|nr:hypothetical protein [Verrucomicrobiota bacterium]
MSGTLSIIDSLSVGAQLKTDRPSACNLCQLDQSLEWTSQHPAEWFGQRQPPLDDDKSTSAMLKGDDAWHMGLTSPQGVCRQLAGAMADPDDERFLLHHLLYSPQVADSQSGVHRHAVRLHRPLDQAKHAELLFGAQGKPLEHITDRLTRQRNNRPMTIQE